MLGAVIAALLAAVPGLADYSSISGDHPARRTATTHMALNLIAVTLHRITFRDKARDGKVGVLFDKTS
jgi:hypothetical protein